ncbi:exopolygalacturonase clone GBGE184-like isoform X2 [Mercurialis annua]|uniref:exopolygalacturonase clone GBGE184-like isoform X2 n=1 Tax=Mercurialis annua TaxID=3986 RepID=UPI0024ADDC88|nr:exopolygalacturonase clone GBGE184-like isoform X2 [Mercurialis annua]
MAITGSRKSIYAILKLVLLLCVVNGVASRDGKGGHHKGGQGGHGGGGHPGGGHAGGGGKGGGHGGGHAGGGQAAGGGKGGGHGGGGGAVFDVTKYGAKADDKSDSALSFIKTWRAACDSGSASRMLIPKGKFVAGPMVFVGPCKGKITVEVQGYIKATTDLSDYTDPNWISFERIDGLTMIGSGTFDGQGSASWKYNKGGGGSLPDQLKFFKVDNSDISGITSLNSKYFHYHIVSCTNVNFHNLHITAPGDSPNTDGMHISSSTGIKLTNSAIGTGDDCVSIGQGATDVTVSKVTCGPGHGFSVGSLGKYKNELDVSGITVTDCTLSGTTNGARIKTYAGSGPSNAKNIIFNNLIMNNVKNPIIIDQFYGSNSKQASKVKLSDIHFTNIRGTSGTPEVVTLKCSSAAPCSQVELSNINLSFGGAKGKASCSNAKVVGKPSPVTCPK